LLNAELVAREVDLRARLACGLQSAGYRARERREAGAAEDNFQVEIVTSRPQASTKTRPAKSSRQSSMQRMPETGEDSLSAGAIISPTRGSFVWCFQEKCMYSGKRATQTSDLVRSFREHDHSRHRSHSCCASPGWQSSAPAGSDPRGVKPIERIGEQSAVLSREKLHRAVSGRGADPFDRSIDMLVARLRHKIEPDQKAARFLVTVPGVGYKLMARPRSALPLQAKLPE
jgi:hypothetical protein